MNGVDCDVYIHAVECGCRIWSFRNNQLHFRRTEALSDRGTAPGTPFLPHESAAAAASIVAAVAVGSDTTYVLKG